MCLSVLQVFIDLSVVQIYNSKQSIDIPSILVCFIPISIPSEEIRRQLNLHKLNFIAEEVL